MSDIPLPIQAPFPLREMPVVDARGYISQAWLMFFLSLQQRTGGASGSDQDANDEDAGRTYALSVESAFAPVGANPGFSAEVTASPAATSTDPLTTDMVMPPVSGGPTLLDVIANIVGFEQTFAPKLSQNQQLNDILAPLVADAVRDILNGETVYADGQTQNAVSEMLAAQGQQQNAVSEMTFAPVGPSAFARDPIQIVPSGSPFTVVARGPYQTLSIDGGSITNITVQRGTWSRVTGNTTPFIAMSPGDTVIITYLAPPALYMLPRI